MNAVSRGMFMALLAKAHPENRLDYTRFFSEEERKACASVSIPATFDPRSLLSLESWFASIHYSWFTSPLEGLNQEAKQLLLSLFPPEQAEACASLVDIPFEKRPLSPLAKMCLLAYLKKKIWEKGVFPEALVPASEMGELLKLSKAQLVHLIDLLGLHDLAADLRQVVDKTLIKKISDALTQEQLQFLHYCQKQAMKWIPAKLNLAGWDGQKQSLTKLLHQRGIVRFGKALADEDHSLKWHLCHRLDRGRGEAVMKVFSGKQDLAMISYFKGQVMHLAKRYQHS